MSWKKTPYSERACAKLRVRITLRPPTSYSSCESVLGRELRLITRRKLVLKTSAPRDLLQWVFVQGAVPDVYVPLREGDDDALFPETPVNFHQEIVLHEPPHFRMIDPAQ